MDCFIAIVLCLTDLIGPVSSRGPWVRHVKPSGDQHNYKVATSLVPDVSASLGSQAAVYS